MTNAPFHSSVDIWSLEYATNLVIMSLRRVQQLARLRNAIEFFDEDASRSQATVSPLKYNSFFFKECRQVPGRGFCETICRIFLTSRYMNKILRIGQNV